MTGGYENITPLGHHRLNVRERKTHALVELAIASTGHGWVVTAIHLGDVVTLDVSDLVHGQETGKGHLR